MMKCYSLDIGRNESQELTRNKRYKCLSTMKSYEKQSIDWIRKFNFIKTNKFV